MSYDVREYGYQEREYFFEGTAKAYGTKAAPARYRSRMIVWRPADPARFNGTTVVEWAEVSGFEVHPEINFQSPMLEHEGYAFVLASAQEGGVCSETPAGCSPVSLKGVDRDRYASLIHPGDAYSTTSTARRSKRSSTPRAQRRSAVSMPVSSSLRLSR